MKLFLPFFIFLFFIKINAQQAFCDKLERVNSLLKENHYAAKPLNDSLSYHVFNSFIESILDSRILFTKDEFNELKKNQFELDNQINSNSCNFIHDFKSSFQKSLNRTLGFYEKLQKESFTYDSSEKLSYSKNKPEYLSSEKEILNLLRKRIKMDILIDIATVSKNKDSLRKNFLSIEKDFKRRIIEQKKCMLNYYLSTPENFSNEIELSFLKSFVNYFDPHSDYFSENEKNIFINGVSEDNLTFGLHFLLNDDNEFYVAEIIPGSQAFKSKRIETQDKLLKITDNKNEIWANCSNINQILALLNSKNTNKLEFYFKKNDGTTYKELLSKTNLKSIENKCYSLIVENNGINYGYINIPSFYTDEIGNNNLSNDLSIQLINLNKENISGLIIDLQNNGGGSIYEAVKISGMFIDIGPLALMTTKENKNEILRDFNRGTNYTDPIVILQNNRSASASEFFANAIQDYKRGIIIGQPSFGKASMQEIFPLFENSKSTDYIKITKEKFYRITGKSHQNIGNQPDVYIPSILDDYSKTEKDLPFAFLNDKIDSSVRYQVWYKNYQKGIENSTKRLENNTYVDRINNFKKIVDKIYNFDDKSIILDFNNVFDYIHNNDSFYKEVEDFEKTEYLNKIRITFEDQDKFKNDEMILSIFDERITILKTNYLLFEATNILYDLNN